MRPGGRLGRQGVEVGLLKHRLRGSRPRVFGEPPGLALDHLDCAKSDDRAETQCRGSAAPARSAAVTPAAPTIPTPSPDEPSLYEFPERRTPSGRPGVVGVERSKSPRGLGATEKVQPKKRRTQHAITAASPRGASSAGALVFEAARVGQVVQPAPRRRCGNSSANWRRQVKAARALAMTPFARRVVEVRGTGCSAAGRSSKAAPPPPPCWIGAAGRRRALPEIHRRADPRSAPTCPPATIARSAGGRQPRGLRQIRPPTTEPAGPSAEPMAASHRRARHPRAQPLTPI